jgi:hypothetical protein
MTQFIDKELKRVQTVKGGEPQAFEWEGHVFQVESILKQWQDFDHSPLSPQKNWRTRKHRNVYQVLTQTGRSFELYCDRGTKMESRRHWVLLKELS